MRVFLIVLVLPYGSNTWWTARLCKQVSKVAVVDFDFQKLINGVFLSKQKLPIKLTLMGAWGVVSTQMPTISQERNS